MPEWVWQLIAPASSALWAFVGVKLALARVEVKIDWLRADVDSAHAKLRDLTSGGHHAG